MKTVVEAGAAAFAAESEWPYVIVGDEEVIGSTGLHRRADSGCLEIGY